MRIAILTDTNSGITDEAAQRLSVHVMSMPFFIDGNVYYEGVNLTQEEFFEKQASGAEISTSMPSPADVMDRWEQLLETHDQVLYIPMSSGLSSSYSTAESLAQDFNGRVFVIDAKRISVPLRETVHDAMKLIERGLEGAEIKRILEKDALNSTVYIAVSTLKYLKKGGRVTPAAAALGTALNIKPVLKLGGGKLDTYAKVRGMKQAEQKMFEAIREEIERFGSDNCMIRAAYSGDEELGKQWIQKVAEAFPDHKVYGDPLGLSIACHTGPSAYGVACIKKLNV